MPKASSDQCLTCGRFLNRNSDPLSLDCGGDCWGCVGYVEADVFREPSHEKVQREIEAGLREADGSPKPPILGPV